MIPEAKIKPSNANTSIYDVLKKVMKFEDGKIKLNVEKRYDLF